MVLEKNGPQIWTCGKGLSKGRFWLDFGISYYWNIEILDYQYIGIMRYFNIEVLEYWDIGIWRY